MIKGFVVALEEDLSEENAARIESAILSLRGVADVTPLRSGPDDWVNRTRIVREMKSAILKAFSDFDNA